ncbi:MAG: DNA/RNA nuclease SfsA [Desulfobacterales bacterium]|nr:DNA/RNA nuclease SfsA [Desulfobacterales bacterium]MBF0397845.1 DNA/RNA nuclease SfsA [Desulfobacterales bacterium]
MNNNQIKGLKWPKLVPGTLIKRYKRFLADVMLKNGEIVIAHCPNSGSMTSCNESGRPVYLSFNPKPERKLKYTWEIIKMPDSYVGVNTLIPNRLVKASIENAEIQEFIHYDKVTSEVKTSDGTRIDLMLTKENGDRCYIEIKNCTLISDGISYFPDAVTKRGLKHIIELQSLVASGNRCFIFFLIQRMDSKGFKPADNIDAAYGKELRRAIQNGVEILIYDVTIDLNAISLNRRLPLMIE